MNPETWLAALAGELRRHGLDRDLAGQVVAEAAAHLRDRGESAARAFGPPEDYAATVARSVAGPAVAPQHAGAVRLDVRGVTKRYGRRTVLAGVDLTVRAGPAAAVRVPQS